MNAGLGRVNSLRSLKELLLCLIIGWFVGSQISHLSGIKVLSVALILIFALSLWRIDWAICLFIFLCPFHFVIKAMYPSVATDLWREIFFLCILVSWLLGIFSKKLPLPSKNILNTVIITYILLGVMGIFRSFDLMVGLAGFRYMFTFVPLYFVTLSTIKGEKEIKKYVNAILISGLIIAAIAIVQFFLTALWGIVEPGTGIDFASIYSSTKAVRLGYYRATSVFASTNELGMFLATCLTFIFVFNFHSPEYRERHHKKLLFSMMIISAGLLLTMSRCSIIAFATSIFAISFVKKVERRWKPILAAFLTIVIFALILPFSIESLFVPLYTFSDPYFEGLRSQHLWNSFWQSPLLGHGFSVTNSAAGKLGLTQFGIISVGAIDNDFLLVSIQIGVVGFLLHFVIWVCFLRNSYLGAKSRFFSETYKPISIAILGILVGVMVASLHLSPWVHVSFSGAYYVLGAIATFIYHEYKDNNLKTKVRDG